MSALRIGILGSGRIAGILARASARFGETLIHARNSAARDAIVASAPDLRAASLDEVASCDLVLLAILPEAYRDALDALAPRLARQAIVGSVTNGVALEEIGARVANPVVKIIPTVAQSVARGVTLVVKGPHADERHVAKVCDWLAQFSSPKRVDEPDIRVASNVAGSAVALMAAFAQAFATANAARAQGLSQADLEAMTAETLGAIGDLARGGMALQAMIDTTATPGGVTEAALAPLKDAAQELCVRMVEASFERQAALQARR